MTRHWKLLALAVALFGGEIRISDLRAQQVGPAKPHVARMIGAAVWPSGYSEVWLLDSPAVRFITNIDVTVFDSSLLIETPEEISAFMIAAGIFSIEDVRQGQLDGSVDGRGVPKEWPARLPPRGGPAQFVPLSSAHPQTSETGESGRICDLLHRHYQANRVQIDAAARQRAIENEKASAAEAMRRAALPPHAGPPVTLQRIEYATPAPSPST